MASSSEPPPSLHPPPRGNEDDDEREENGDDSPAEDPDKFETVPTFHPTVEEMRDFDGYLARLNRDHKCGQTGLCKIVPPQEWGWRPKREDARRLTVRTPIQQAVLGRAGVFSVVPIEKKDMSVERFEQLAESRPCPVKSIETEEDFAEVERRFWRSLTTTSEAPLYGADVPGTVFGDADVEFNVNTLDCMLKRCGVRIAGITSPMLYVGSWRSFFPYHTEDLNMFSINVNHMGAPKFWYGVPPSAGRRLETLAETIWGDERKRCPEFLRHKSKMFSPTRLKNAGIPFVRAVQRAREIIVTWPACYHAGFNSGYNCAEAVNFVVPSLADYYLSFARKAGVCKCRPDSVSISIPWMEAKFAEETSKRVAAEREEKTLSTSSSSEQEMTTNDSVLMTKSVNAPDAKRARTDRTNDDVENDDFLEETLLPHPAIPIPRKGDEVMLSRLVSSTIGATDDDEKDEDGRESRSKTVAKERYRVVSVTEGFVRLHRVGGLKVEDVWVDLRSDRLSMPESFGSSSSNSSPRAIGDEKKKQKKRPIAPSFISASSPTSSDPVVASPLSSR